MISTIDFLRELDKREGELVLKVERFEGFVTSQACAKAECDLVHELRNKKQNNKDYGREGVRSLCQKQDLNRRKIKL